jgi:hypothetical protein
LQLHQQLNNAAAKQIGWTREGLLLWQTVAKRKSITDKDSRLEVASAMQILQCDSRALCELQQENIKSNYCLLRAWCTLHSQVHLKSFDCILIETPHLLWLLVIAYCAGFAL